MSSKYDFDHLAPGKAQRLPVPEGTEQRRAIANARAALAGWRRRAMGAARTKKAAAEIERRTFAVLPSGEGHIRIKRTDAPAEAPRAAETPSVTRVSAKGKAAARRSSQRASSRKQAAAAA